MKKAILKRLNEIAKNLPNETFLASYEPIEITGHDCILAGTNEINGFPVDPDKQYLVKVPLIREVDHIRRLKEAYKAQGRAGVIHYCRPYVKPDLFGKFQINIMRFLP